MGLQRLVEVAFGLGNPCQQVQPRCLQRLALLEPDQQRAGIGGQAVLEI